jgi:sodium-independent sulfate anion transporter 11
MAAAAATKLVKNTVHYEEEVPTVSAKSYLAGIASHPGQKVCLSPNPSLIVLALIHRAQITNYLTSLFPIFSWITRYNLTWLTGDLIAGITVGIVAVPQSMSYAVIATLPAEYGLYSSFVGVLIYCVSAVPIHCIQRCAHKPLSSLPRPRMSRLDLSPSCL